MAITSEGTATMTAHDKTIAVHGDSGQAEGLLDKKKGFSTSGKKGS